MVQLFLYAQPVVPWNVFLTGSYAFRQKKIRKRKEVSCSRRNIIIIIFQFRGTDGIRTERTKDEAIKSVFLTNFDEFCGSFFFHGTV